MLQAKTKLLDVTIEVEKSSEGCETDFLPILRSGAWTDIGFRHTMEDAYVCSDNFILDYGLQNYGEGPSAFYGVHDVSFLFFF